VDYQKQDCFVFEVLKFHQHSFANILLFLELLLLTEQLQEKRLKKQAIQL
jgi:hypothetical protein